MASFDFILNASSVTVSLIINIEDDDHRVQLWEGATGGPYIYVEDLVKSAGVARLLFDSNGKLVCR